MKGFLYRGQREGIVPISSGKRATVGVNRSVLGNKKTRNDGSRFRNVKSWWRRRRL